MQKSGQKTVPNVFVNGEHVGGCDKTLEAHQSGRLQFLLNKSREIPAEGSDVKYDYDLVVIGGGSGGLAASKVIINHPSIKRFLYISGFLNYCLRKLRC